MTTARFYSQHRTRLAIPTLCLLTSVTIACWGAQRAETIDAAGGQKIVREFYSDGTIKTLTRLNPDGRLVGKLYHTTNGTPTHFDYYDDLKRVRRSLLYRADGTAHTSQEFDEQHSLVIETRFDEKRAAVSDTYYFQRGRVMVHSPASWETITHKIDASQDVVGFQIPNSADEGTPDSANVIAVSYDLSHATNRVAFADRRKESASRTAKPSQSNEWAVYTFHDKQGDTRYEIRDAYRALGRHYGVHVRLAFPELPKTTKEWRQSLEADFKRFLETVETKGTK